MKIRSIQKIIKVGSSLAVTIPSRDARAAGLKPGKEVSVTVSEVISDAKPKKNTLDADYQAFKKQYGQTLKRLANR